MEQIKLKKIGYGLLAQTHNDGRAVFCETLDEAREKVGTVRGELLRIDEGFIVQVVGSEDNYGFYCGINEEDAISLVEESYSADEVSVFYED